MKKSEIKWNEYIKALRQFASEHGHTAVPANYSIGDGEALVKLGNWVGYIRARGRSGRLSDARKSVLESIPEWSWSARKPGPQGNPNRDNEIARARMNGKSLQSIAIEWNLSRQRVHQIVRRMEIKA